jgi:aryl-alcohol dehydrogenase-like predicted oxidoreductase
MIVRTAAREDTMEVRRLGSAGPLVSVVGLGCNNFGMKLDERQSVAVVHAALDAGITHFDTAEMYGGGQSEVLLGKALGNRRESVVVATKFADRPEGEPYRPGILRKRILEGCDISLGRLGTDHIDLYYQHHPDSEAPVEEALEALMELTAAGKVRHVACSNYGPELVEEAVTAARRLGFTGFVADQVHWNLLSREVETGTVPALRKHGLGIVPFFPLEAGLLTGKYAEGEEWPEGSRLVALPRFSRFATKESFARVRHLAAFAGERSHNLLELAFGWLLSQSGVASVIAGATTPEQVMANVQAGSAWRLTPEEMAAVPAD